MSNRTLGFTLFVALATGCASASASSRFQSSTPPDPDRFARAACLRGGLPAELDGHAYAAARTVDLAAERQAAPSPRATERLLTERQVFEARCAEWRRTASPNGATEFPGLRVVTVSYPSTP
jgi:hypothetical protein